MSDHQIYLHELILLLAWLSAPALLLSSVALIVVFGRFGMFRIGRRLRAIVGLATSVIAILAVALVLWFVVPKSLWSDEVLLPDPGPRGILLPPVFAPAIAAALLVVPLTVWFTIRGLTRRWSERPPAARSPST